MRCQCNVSPRVISGSPVKDGDKSYWKQIFICDNPNCTRYKNQIGERLVNIFDESEVIEKEYSSSI